MLSNQYDKLPSQNLSCFETQGDSRRLTSRPSSASPSNVAKLLWRLASLVTRGCFRGDLSRGLNMERAEPFSAFNLSLTSLECSLLFTTERMPEDTYLSTCSFFSSLLLPTNFLAWKGLAISSVSPKSCLLFPFTWPRWSTSSTPRWVLWVFFCNLNEDQQLCGIWKFYSHNYSVYWSQRLGATLSFFFAISKCPLRLIDALSQPGWRSCIQKGKRKSILIMSKASPCLWSLYLSFGLILLPRVPKDSWLNPYVKSSTEMSKTQFIFQCNLHETVRSVFNHFLWWWEMVPEASTMTEATLRCCQ